MSDGNMSDEHQLDELDELENEIQAEAEAVVAQLAAWCRMFDQRLILALAQHLLLILFAPGVSAASSNAVRVTPLNLTDWTAALSNGTIDALIDVRTAEEFGAQWGRVGACNRMSDPRACDYGHVPGAYWLPGLHKLDTADLIKHIAGDPRGLPACAGLRLAFICHSGVRSNEAATRLAAAYLDHGISAFNASTVHGGAILNAGSGTEGFFAAGLPTSRGFARAEWPGCVELSRFAATWQERPPSRTSTRRRLGHGRRLEEEAYLDSRNMSNGMYYRLCPPC